MFLLGGKWERKMIISNKLVSALIKNREYVNLSFSTPNIFISFLWLCFLRTKASYFTVILWEWAMRFEVGKSDTLFPKEGR